MSTVKLKSKNEYVSSVFIKGETYKVKDGVAEFKPEHVTLAMDNGFEVFLEEKPVIVSKKK